MKRVRETMGLTNLILMIPFCRRVPEAEKVLEEMAKNGLRRGENGLEVYVMCEIPNNVLMIDEFSQVFDGFSIGSNDLTQLTLGVDRDSSLVAHDFDERDPGVLRIVSQAVQGAKRNGRHSGICGQAPSDYPEFAEFLFKEGIDSMSLNPDSVMKITLRVLEMEQKIKWNGTQSKQSNREKPEETEKICEEKKEFFTSVKKENAGIVEICRGFLTKPDAKRAALA